MLIPASDSVLIIIEVGSSEVFWVALVWNAARSESSVFELLVEVPVALVLVLELLLEPAEAPWA